MNLLRGKLFQCFRHPKLLVTLAAVVCLGGVLLLMYPVHAATPGPADTSYTKQCSTSSDADANVAVCIYRYHAGYITTSYSLLCDSKNTAGTGTIYETQNGQELNSWSKSFPCTHNSTNTGGGQGPNVSVPDRGVDYSFAMKVQFSDGTGESARTPTV